MLQISHWIILFLIGVSHVQLGCGQYVAELPLNYNLQEMLERTSSIMSSSREFKGLSNDQDWFSDSEQYSDAVSDENIDQFPTHLMYDSGDNNSSDNNSSEEKCNEDLKYAFEDLQAHDKLGYKMLDAFGKLESGVLEGRVKWVGDYHECINIYTPPNETYKAGDFIGQYCMLDMTVNVFDKKMPISVGVCLPDSCGPVPVEDFNVSGLFGPDVNITKKTCQPTSKEVTSAAIVMICVISFFVILSLVGSCITVYDYFAKMSTQDTLLQYSSQINEEDMEIQQIQDSSTSGSRQSGKNGCCGTLKEFFNCFCVFTNGEKILNTDSAEGQMLCLHGIRFLSLAWVIVCHTYGMLLSNLGNILETADILDAWLFQIILNGFYSVDSFYLLSGFLVAYLYFQESSKRKGKISWLYFYIHRYVRLTPVYMVVLGFYTTLYYYIGAGPFWQTTDIDPVCKETWWYNILYINNLVPQEKYCMPWSWYLATDMQFFIISPIVLITLWRWPAIGYSVMGLFMSATVATNIGITYQYNFHSGFGQAGGGSSIMDLDINALMAEQKIFNDQIYAKPYTRMSPYLIGIALAYFLFKRKQRNAGKLNLVTLVGGWIVSAAISLACVFCLYHRKFSVTESAFYNAFSHIGFAISLSWVIFTCLNKQAGPVNSILSFKLFLPLSRLTYCAYLIHLIILNGYFGAMKTLLQFSHITMVTLFLGLLMIIYTAAFAVSVVFEAPIIRLDKLVRTKLMH